MTKLRAKEIKTMSNENKDKKIKELKLELMKSQSSAQKTGSSRIKEIKKTIARILTIKSMEKKK